MHIFQEAAKIGLRPGLEARNMARMK